MKLQILVVLIVSVVIVRSRPAQFSSPAEIVLYETDGDDTSYNFQFETSDGIARVEKGELKETGPGESSLSVEGAYVYTDDKGVEHKVRYKADETGYHVLPNVA